jgi:hypothetical protein
VSALPAPLARAFREPFTAFALVAAALFAWDARPGDGAAEPEPSAPATTRVAAPAASAPEGNVRTIVVTERLVQALRDDFTWLEGRPPSPDEVDALVDRWLADEILFREALAMQLHRWDSKVRERLVNRVRVLWSGPGEEPDEATLLDHYVEHLDEFRTEPRLRFDHVYFAEPPADAAAVLARLRAGEPVRGDDFWLGRGEQVHGTSILRSSFGGRFHTDLANAEPGTWTGPLRTARGVHFVRLLERLPPEPLPYAMVRDRVRTDYLARSAEAAVAARLAGTEPRYRIRRAYRMDDA